MNALLSGPDLAFYATLPVLSGWLIGIVLLLLALAAGLPRWFSAVGAGVLSTLSIHYSAYFLARGVNLNRPGFTSVRDAVLQPRMIFSFVIFIVWGLMFAYARGKVKFILGACAVLGLFYLLKQATGW